MYVVDVWVHVTLNLLSAIDKNDMFHHILSNISNFFCDLTYELAEV